MIIGPFWCEEKKYWLRFVSQTEGFSAEIATRKEDQPDLATEWRLEKDKNFWIINYKPSSDESVNEGLRLQNGQLFHTNFRVSKILQTINVSIYKATGQFVSYNISNPFQGLGLGQPLEITPYHKLPMTEEIQQKLRIETERLQEQQREIQEQKWLKWQTQNVRETCTSGEISTFTPQQSAALYHGLSLALSEFSPEKYPSFEAYLKALNSAISDPKDPIHETIQDFAARTHIDVELNLNPTHSEIERAKLFEGKQAFAYALLQAEREQLLRHYDVEITPIKTVTLKLLKVPGLRAPDVQADPIQPMPVDNAPDLQALELQPALDESLTPAQPPTPALESYEEIVSLFQRFINRYLSFQPQPTVVRNPEEPSVYSYDALQLQHGIEQSLKKDPSRASLQQEDSELTPGLTQNTVPIVPIVPSKNTDVLFDTDIAVALSEKNNSQLIKEAVTKAVMNYAEWYKIGKDHRGPNGFFSWFRHGPQGQEQAKTLHTKILNSTFEEDAISEVNSFLTGKNTRFQRHSLASFMLDQLSLLKDLPWHGLSPDTLSNCYDAKTVSQHLDDFYSINPQMVTSQ